MAQNPSIVVIEDNPSDVYLIGKALSASDVQADVRVLEDGEAALAMIEEWDRDSESRCPALLLLDVSLPKADGFQVLRRLRQSARGSEIPVVVMTSSSSSADREKSAGLGASEFFPKPSQYDAFLEIGKIAKRHLV